MQVPYKVGKVVRTFTTKGVPSLDAASITRQMFSPAPAAGPSITTIHVLTGIVSVITLGGIIHGLYSDHCRRRDSQFHKNPKKPSRN